MTTKNKINRNDVIAYIKECTAVDLGQLLIDSDKPLEAEQKKGFTWEESFSCKGYYIDNSSILKNACFSYIRNVDNNVFRTEKQALSALAFAQLSHIVAKYNEGKSISTSHQYCWIRPVDVNVLAIGEIQSPTNLVAHGLHFVEYEDAVQSLITNKELWERYWML